MHGNRKLFNIFIFIVEREYNKVRAVWIGTSGLG